MASINDKITTAVARWSGKIGSGGVAGSTTTTIPLSSSTNLTNGEIYYFTINRVDSSGNKNTLAEMETVKGELSGSNFINCVRGEEGTAQAWAAGVVVEILFTASQWNSLKTWAEVEHNQDGTHTTATVTTLKASGSDVNTGTSDTSIVTPKALNDSYLGDYNTMSLYRNAIINGNFDIWQRGTSFTAASSPLNSDDTYLMDRWNLLSDGNDIVDVSQSTDSPDGSKYSAKFLVATANKKFGIVQFLENKDAMKLDNKTVSVSFQAKTTTAKVINNLRVAVLSWDGTADAVTSDIVSAWAASGTNPTWATNWTAENTSANLAITTSWAKYSVTGIDIDTASMANIAVVIWVDDADAATGDELFISQVQLCAGSVALPFQPKSYADELRACQRYYEKSYPSGYAAGSTPGATYADVLTAQSIKVDTSNTRALKTIYFKVRKRNTPSVTVYDANDGSSGKGRFYPDNTSVTLTVWKVKDNQANILLDGGVTSGWTYDSSDSVWFYWIASAEL